MNVFWITLFLLTFKQQLRLEMWGIHGRVVTMKNCFPWCHDVSQVRIQRRFGKTCFLHSALWRWSQYVPPNGWWIPVIPYSVNLQRTTLVITVLDLSEWVTLAICKCIMHSDKWMWVVNSITLQITIYCCKILILKLFFLAFFEYLCNWKALQRKST
jgi:hypothetical protein